jgi:hypothetical protein
MSDEEIFALLKRMRQAQRDYYEKKGPDRLQIAKALEARADRALAERDRGPGLFDGGDAND